MCHSNIDFEALFYLPTAAETGAINRAGKSLGIASLSKRVQKIED
jgi:hypothetical protein